MERLTISTAGGRRFLEGTPGRPLIATISDVRALLEACFNRGADRLLLHAENMTPGFFDLSSGEAGTILQKLRNYGIRLAVVASPPAQMSRRFGELLEQERRGPYFRVFPDREQACEWLARD
jgi:hypothetical protein